jgi:hypothetical protein
MNRIYVVDDEMIFNRKEFEAFLITWIFDNELFELRNLLGDGAIGVELHVKHHPLRIAREIFGEDKVLTFTI